MDKIQRFSERRQKAEAAYEQRPLSHEALHTYNRRLDETLKLLQDQLKRQEDELNKLRITKSIDLSDFRTDPWVRLSRVRRAKKGYDSLLKQETLLPAPTSPLPSLIAIEETGRLIKESKTSISMTANSLSVDRQRLQAEEANLRDARLITSGLEERISRIRTGKSNKEQKTPSQLANELVGQHKGKNEELKKSTENMKSSLDKFIDDKLAAMLAAEDIGGPTAGDALDLSDAVLEAGYTNRGRPKKQKSATLGDQDGQQRIDDLVHRRNGQDNQTRQRNKREKAAAEMHALLDALLEAGPVYIDVPRDSAASRFLVKAKVAQFHHRDARRLKLIDFGRSIDD